MIKACFLFSKGKIIADYYNNLIQQQFVINSEFYEKFLKNNQEINLIKKLEHFSNQQENFFIFSFFYLSDLFVLCFLVENSEEKIIEENLIEICKEVKTFVLRNYEEESQRGKMTQTFTGFLRDVLSVYENETIKSSKIGLIKQSLQNLKQQAEINFKKLISRSENLEDLGQEIEVTSQISESHYLNSYKLKKKIWNQRMKVYLLIGGCFVVTCSVIYFLI